MSDYVVLQNFLYSNKFFCSLIEPTADFKMQLLSLGLPNCCRDIKPILTYLFKLLHRFIFHCHAMNSEHADWSYVWRYENALAFSVLLFHYHKIIIINVIHTRNFDFFKTEKLKSFFLKIIMNGFQTLAK